MKAEINCLYLFSDGHAVIVYQKPDKHTGAVHWAEIHENWGPRCRFPGRIVFHATFSSARGILKLCRKAHTVRAQGPSLDRGSNATRELGLKVATLTVQFSEHWDDTVHFNDIPGALSACFTIQDDDPETFDPEAVSWGGYHVAKIHRVKPVAQSVAVAA